jgi:hypothetical protein
VRLKVGVKPGRCRGIDESRCPTDQRSSSDWAKTGRGGNRTDAPKRRSGNTPKTGISDRPPINVRPPNCRTADHQESGQTLLFTRSRLSLFCLPRAGNVTPDERIPRSVSSLRGPQVHLAHDSGRIAQLLSIGRHSAASYVNAAKGPPRH